MRIAPAHPGVGRPKWLHRAGGACLRRQLLGRTSLRTAAPIAPPVLGPISTAGRVLVRVRLPVPRAAPARSRVYPRMKQMHAGVSALGTVGEPTCFLGG